MSDVRMQGAVGHPLVRKIMDYQAAMARGELEAGRAVFQPDVVYVVPGVNALSGRYVGPDAVMGYFGRLMQVTQGSYRISEMTWLVCGEKVLLETMNHASIADRSLDWREAIAFEFRDGRKALIDLYQADQGAVDAFFGV